MVCVGSVFTKIPCYLLQSQVIQMDDDDNIYEQMDAAVVPGEMSLTAFTKNFSHSLPQQVSYAGVAGNFRMVEILVFFISYPVLAFSFRMKMYTKVSEN